MITYWPHVTRIQTKNFICWSKPLLGYENCAFCGKMINKDEPYILRPGPLHYNCLGDLKEQFIVIELLD